MLSVFLHPLAVPEAQVGAFIEEAFCTIGTVQFDETVAHTDFFRADRA